MRLVSPIGGATGGSGKLSSLYNVAKLRQNLCGFSTPTAMGQSFIMSLYNVLHIHGGFYIARFSLVKFKNKKNYQ
jgi:hypothetical protein